MDEQEVKLMEEVPSPSLSYDGDPLSDGDVTSYGSYSVPRSPQGATFGKMMAIIAGGISLLFFAVSTFALVKELDFSGELLIKMMIGDTVGGGRELLITALPQKETSADTVMTADTPSSDSPAESPIIPVGKEYTVTLSNETPYSPNMNELVKRPRSIPPLSELYSEYGADAPIVLILHTHGTEAYTEHASTDYRTTDKSENIVSVGKLIAEQLNNAGINTIHCETMFDSDNFNLAYYNASLTIRRTIEEHPSVSYIIDVHRDSVTLPGGVYLPLHAIADGKTAAQLMFVIGTDHGGSGHITWEKNLSLAARLQTDIHSRYEGMMRSINLRSASFNQQYADGSMILEVGTCANTLEEAKISALIFADALICEIIGD